VASHVARKRAHSEEIAKETGTGKEPVFKKLS